MNSPAALLVEEGGPVDRGGKDSAVGYTGMS
jgi:hypothetical protein